ncbi:hypothetical protein KIN20_010783 [Parelaphostrongylus tenuis]|uniref:Uncharacterized protein n=1 Tax=Parelaphostrongylus tenuis TaxID=148309 RepID=A0AAD5M8E0_PARTN|nr:hypothetical protein KIN20_010783 [Parelaphostrongylus tenuis]
MRSTRTENDDDDEDDEDNDDGGGGGRATARGYGKPRPLDAAGRHRAPCDIASGSIVALATHQGIYHIVECHLITE